MPIDPEERCKILIDIDPNLAEIEYKNNFDDHEFNRKQIKFEEKIHAAGFRYIDGEMEYSDSQTFVDIVCLKCGCVTTIKPVNVSRLSCGFCRKKEKEISKEKELWERTLAIIEDKKGKLINFNADDIAGKLSGKMTLQCKNNHRWIATHLDLRKDKWCHKCRMAGELIPKSPRAYVLKDRRITAEENFKKLKKTVELKGCILVTEQWLGYKGQYTVICKTCSETTIVSAEQILRNKNLCQLKCTAGICFRLSDVRIES